MTPTNMGSFSGSYSYVSPSASFTSPGNQSGHVSFDRVSLARIIEPLHQKTSLCAF